MNCVAGEGMCIPSDDGEGAATNADGDGTGKAVPGDGAIILEGEGAMVGPSDGGDVRGKLAGDGCGCKIKIQLIKNISKQIA